MHSDEMSDILTPDIYELVLYYMYGVCLYSYIKIIYPDPL